MDHFGLRLLRRLTAGVGPRLGGAAGGGAGGPGAGGRPRLRGCGGENHPSSPEGDTPHSTTQRNTVQHSAARHKTARQSTARHGKARHGTAWHATAQHGTERGKAWHSTKRSNKTAGFPADAFFADNLCFETMIICATNKRPPLPLSHTKQPYNKYITEFCDVLCYFTVFCGSLQNSKKKNCKKIYLPLGGRNSESKSKSLAIFCQFGHFRLVITNFGHLGPFWIVVSNYLPFWSHFLAFASCCVFGPILASTSLIWVPGPVLSNTTSGPTVLRRTPVKKSEFTRSEAAPVISSFHQHSHPPLHGVMFCSTPHKTTATCSQLTQSS